MLLYSEYAPARRQDGLMAALHGAGRVVIALGCTSAAVLDERNAHAHHLYVQACARAAVHDEWAWRDALADDALVHDLTCIPN